MKEKLSELQKLMLQGGLDESAQLTGEMLSGTNSNDNATTNKTTPMDKANAMINSESEETIYKPAIKGVHLQERDSNRLSSSSDEGHNTSDESNDIQKLFSTFPGSSRRNRNQGDSDDNGGQLRFKESDTLQQRDNTKRTQRRIPEDRAEWVIRESEAARGRVYSITGNNIAISNDQEYKLNYTKERIHSMLVDEEYSAIGSHLDANTIEKIKTGAYVDFSKLLPRDRLAIEEDNRLQPIVKDGQVFWQPPADHNNIGMNISSYYKWEQAFKVYSNVYTKEHPQRASELIQYSHDIHAASLTYIWENVYQYDKEFRLHLARYPTRSWTVTLQHAWNLKMREKVHHDHKNDRNCNWNNSSSGQTSRINHNNELCKTL